jgi:hypothetical protein
VGNEVDRSEVKILWDENDDNGKPKTTPLFPYDEFSVNHINVRGRILNLLYENKPHKHIGPTENNMARHRYNHEWEQIMANAEINAPLRGLRKFAEDQNDQKLLNQVNELLEVLRDVERWAAPVKAAVAP